MQLTYIIDKCSHLLIADKRCVTDELVDLVFLNEQVDQWQEILTSYLGDPIKPKGKRPSDKDLKITAHTGGIRIEQTLFEKKFEQTTIIAKFWPWQDNQHTTLRMALLIIKA